MFARVISQNIIHYTVNFSPQLFLFVIQAQCFPRYILQLFSSGPGNHSFTTSLNHFSFMSFFFDESLFIDTEMGSSVSCSYLEIDNYGFKIKTKQ